MEKPVIIDDIQMDTLRYAIATACEHTSNEYLLNQMANTLGDITIQFNKP